MIKKLINKWTIAMSICLVSILSLFAMTKTYAYDLDNNGNLVGNNLLNENNTISTKIEDLNDNNTFSFINGNPTYTFNFENETNNGFITYTLKNNDLSPAVFVNYSVGILLETENMMDDNISINIRCGSINNYGNISNGQTLINSNMGYIADNVSRLQFVYASLYPAINTRYGYSVQLNLSNNTNLNGKIKITFFMFNNIKTIGINSNQTFYAYSSIEQLQQDYNTLLGQYNDLQTAYTNYQSTHSYTNTQYNNLVSQINTLQGQLSQLQLQYDTYVATHSYTDTEYNTLQQQYNNLQTQYNTLNVNYNTLQQQYDEQTRILNQMKQFATMGSLAYIQNIEIWSEYNQVQNTNYYTIQQFIDAGIIYQNRMDINLLQDIDEDIAPNNEVYLHFIENTITKNNINLTFNAFSPFQELWINYKKENGQSDSALIRNFKQDQTIDYFELDATTLDLNINEQNYYIESIEMYHVNYGSDVNRFKIIEGSLVDMLSYNSGYASGRQSQAQNIINLENDIKALTNQITQLNQNYALLQQNYNTLNTQYNTLNGAYTNLVEQYNDLQNNDGNDLYNMVIRK